MDIGRLAFLICRGGWPKAVGMEDEDALALAFDYYDAVVESDISRYDCVRRNAELARRLARSLARHQGAQVSLETIRQDRGANDESILGESSFAQYMNALKSIFVVDDMPAWNPNLRSKTAIRTSDTRYFNDSSIAIKDRELTAQMAASYNYNHYQKQALKNAEKASQRLYLAVVLLSLSIILIKIAIFFYLRYRNSQKKLNHLQREYAEAQDNYNRTQHQLQQLEEKHKKMLNSIRKGNTPSQSIITMLNSQHEEEKKQLTQQLHSYRERVEQLERQLNISQYTKSSIPFLNLGIVKRIKIYAADSRRQLSENDLRTLADAVKEYFPDLLTDLEGSPDVTPLAKNVCLLSLLNLKPGEIVNLLGVSSSQVSNLRKEINFALFNENTTRTLYQNLSRRYKILST